AQALLYAFIASAALVVGGVCGASFRLPQRVVASALAFAAGALVSPFAFELVLRPYEQSGAWVVGIALVVGAVVFVAADEWIEVYERGSAGLAITAGVILDGIPENLALGATIGEAGGLAILVAVFASNLPESFAGAVGMREDGRSPRV